jgi:hypothetical protein
MIIIEINKTPIEKYELPEKLSPKNVCFYSHHAKEVEGNIRSKAKKFLELGCIQYDYDMKCFYCNPIKNYNKSRYKIESKGDRFVCDCQYNVRVGENCSHILAVYLWLKIHNWNKKEVENEKRSLEIN